MTHCIIWFMGTEVSYFFFFQESFNQQAFFPQPSLLEQTTGANLLDQTISGGLKLLLFLGFLFVRRGVFSLTELEHQASLTIFASLLMMDSTKSTRRKQRTNSPLNICNSVFFLIMSSLPLVQRLQGAGCSIQCPRNQCPCWWQNQ